VTTLAEFKRQLRMERYAEQLHAEQFAESICVTCGYCAAGVTMIDGAPRCERHRNRGEVARDSRESLKAGCPIRGHDHDVRVIERHTQAGTGKKATTYGCPSGVYRWFVPDGQPLGGLRIRRPRGGWRK